MSIIRQGFESADLDVPVVLPTLNLDFANSQSLDKRITFSRGSIGTRVNRNGLIETIPANQPRFDFDPISGECRGLLIEESRTNLLTYSEDFTNASWGVGNLRGTITANQTTAPDGTTTTADLYQEDTTTNGRYFAKSISVTSGTSYTVSIWAKQAPGSTRYLGLILPLAGFGVNVTASFTLSGVGIYTISTSGTSTSAGIQAYPNGWYRCYLTSQATASANPSSQFRLSDSSTNGNANYAGDGTSGIYVWGAQVEAGSVPTSYIPTTASTVTRSADNAQMTGTNFSSWYNQSEGTVFCSFKTDGISGGPRTFQLTGNNQNERLDHRIIGNVNGSEYYTGGINFGRIDDNGVTNPSQGKITVSQNSRSRQFCMNGRTVKSATIPNAPAVNTLNIGNYNLQFTYLNGTIRKLAYYPKALSPAELQYLTQ
jgi:hypothetical protein